MLFRTTSKKHKKSVCCHTDNDSDDVHVVTIFLVAYTCHSKVYLGIGQENNTVYKNHRRCKTSQCRSCNVLVWLPDLDECVNEMVAKILFTGDLWGYYALLTWHKIVKALDWWLVATSFSKNCFCEQWSYCRQNAVFQTEDLSQKEEMHTENFQPAKPPSPWNRINHTIQIDWALEYS